MSAQHFELEAAGELERKLTLRYLHYQWIVKSGGRFRIEDQAAD